MYCKASTARAQVKPDNKSHFQEQLMYLRKHDWKLETKLLNYAL